MTSTIDLDHLLASCSDAGTEAAIRIQTELEPIGGPGASVKPAVYEGGRYQQDHRWETVEADEAAPVIVIDNVPSQANRLEAALRAISGEVGLPEIVLDLSGVADLPAHLPRTLSSWQFPHRNADAYLRDAQLDGVDFTKTDLGKAIFAATPWAAGPLMSWFPQAMLYGFWQSHLGKKRANTKHARAWVSEIIGWRPAATDTRTLGVKGDPLNLSGDDQVTSDENDRETWSTGKVKIEGAKTHKLSKIGHGQVPFMREDDPDAEKRPAAAGVSFARVSQLATVSFAQLRRVSVGEGAPPEADTAARALLAALGLLGHASAFGRGFALRSGADLVPNHATAQWVGASRDSVELPTISEATALLSDARNHAESAGVPLDGWGREPIALTAKDNLADAIRATWPLDGIA
ncbi:MAG: type I-G CRISPR-associated RAMP protein Csb1/Cas7g [Iamia sp.]